MGQAQAPTGGVRVLHREWYDAPVDPDEVRRLGRGGLGGDRRADRRVRQRVLGARDVDDIMVRFRKAPELTPSDGTAAIARVEARLADEFGPYALAPDGHAGQPRRLPRSTAVSRPPGHAPWYLTGQRETLRVCEDARSRLATAPRYPRFLLGHPSIVGSCRLRYWVRL